MKCKFCGAELEEGVLTCPVCQQTLEDTVATPAEQPDLQETVLQAQTEEPVAEEPVAEVQEELQPKPKNTKWKSAVAMICGIVLVLGLQAGLWYWYNGGWLLRENNIHYSDQYTKGGTLLKLSANRVVATVGDKQLTNEELQVLYWMQFYNAVSYGAADSLDHEKPFCEQEVPGLEGEEARTWEQYLLELCLENWQRYQVLVMDAEKSGMTMPENYQDYLRDLPGNLEEQVNELGYDTLDEYLKTMIGPGATAEAYISYMDLANRAEYYFSQWFADQEPTREEISAFFDEHAKEFESQYGVTKETGKLVDVRHILIKPEGATADANGMVVATDDQWEQCRQDAQAMLDAWKTFGTEEAFAALANEKSIDGGSNTNGGLYSGVPKGYMVENFDAWIFDESRKAGDTGLVRTEFGYHIMYYCGGDEAWYLVGKDEVVNDWRSQKLEKLVEASTLEVNYRAIVLGQADLERIAN